MRQWKQIIVLTAALVAFGASAQTDPEPKRSEVRAREERRQPPVPAEKPLAAPSGGITTLRPPAAVQGDSVFVTVDGGSMGIVQGKKEKAAFLGISGSPLAPALREQLKLPAGVGMVIDYVEPGSPAYEAGLKQYDVLHKLEDQLIINAHQLAVLVRTHKPNEEVTLTVIHQSESKPIKVRLIEKEVMALDERSPWGVPPSPWETNFVADAFSAKPLTATSVLPVPPSPKTDWYYNPTRLDFRGNVHVQTSDDTGSLTYIMDDSGKHLIAKDKEGRTIFEGMVNTPEERNVLPPALREKLKRLEASMHSATTQPVQGIGQSGVIRFNTNGKGIESGNIQVEERKNEKGSN